MDDLLIALQNTADGAFVIDSEQHIVYWNTAAEQLLGYLSEEVLGRSCWEVLENRDAHGRLVCSRECRLAQVALAGVPLPNYDTCVRTQTGNTRWINVSTLTLIGAGKDNTPIVVHLFRDATRKKQHEDFIANVVNAMDRLRSGAPPSLMGTPSIPDMDLTEREREVLYLLVRGLSTRSIAQSLSISPSTTRNHIQNILNKLQVHSRLEAVAYAIEHGLIASL